MNKNSTAKRTKILLVDDEDLIKISLTRALELAGFEVVTANNGKVAKEIVDMEEFDLVISDLHMPSSPVSGIELFEYIKSSPRPLPFILMTGFGTISETKNAHEMGVTAFMAKPFKIEDLIKLLKSLADKKGEPASNPDNEPQLDADFSKLSIDDFISGKEIQYGIYIRLSENKYVKIAHRGENLPVERIRAYREKRIRFLYLLKEDFHRYLNFTLTLNSVAIGSSKVPPAKKANLHKHTGEVIMEQLFSNDVPPESFENAKAIVENSVSLLSETQNTFDLLTALNDHADFLYAHSLGVSLYAVMIAKAMEWTSHSTLFKVGVAGLLHDIGKKEIDKNIVMKARSSLLPEEIKVLETHCARGLEILSSNGYLSNDIIQVVYQHHEREFGTGYPLKLPKSKIAPLARLVAVADEFCRLVIKNPDSAGMSPKAAISRLVASQGKALDFQFVACLGKVLKVDVSIA